MVIVLLAIKLDFNSRRVLSFLIDPSTYIFGVNFIFVVEEYLISLIGADKMI